MTYPICKFEECEKWMLEMLALFNFIDIDSRKSWWKVYYGDKKIRVACMKSYRKKEIDYLLSKDKESVYNNALTRHGILLLTYHYSWLPEEEMKQLIRHSYSKHFRRGGVRAPS